MPALGMRSDMRAAASSALPLACAASSTTRTVNGRMRCCMPLTCGRLLTDQPALPNRYNEHSTNDPIACRAQPHAGQSHPELQREKPRKTKAYANRADQTYEQRRARATRAANRLTENDRGRHERLSDCQDPNR